MEDKRKDGGHQPPHSTAAESAGTPSKHPDSVPAAEPPSSRRRGGSHKRKTASISSGNNGATPQTTSSKRQAREKSSAAAPIHNGPLTRARQSPPADEAVKIETAAAEAGAGLIGARVVAETSGVVEVDWEAKIEAEYEVIRSRGVNVHAVPIPAGWFSWSKVHPLEEQAMPSFFNGKSEKRTPEIYMDIRNWIMRKFHANPSSLVELKDLSDLPIGELDARQEVMEFLDHWGLINYHPFPENISAMNHNDDGEAKTDSLVEKLYRFETEQSCAPVMPRTNAVTPAAPSRIFPESSVAEELTKTEEGPSVEYHCNSCSADCSRKRYHNQKQADFDLCSECFNNGKFDSDMSPTDFILMEPAEAAGVSGGKWTDQETLLLLEALELYKENWNEIAEHVATKTKTQCILHFVQMPIEETFMDRDDDIDASLKETADPATDNTDSSASKDPAETTESRNVADEKKPESCPMEILKPEDPSEVKVGEETNENCAFKALKEAFEAVGSFPAPGEQFSFAEAGNPVMALAAFLVRMAEPKLAAALVGSSLKSISGNSSSTQLAARHCFLLHDPPDNKKKSADSEKSVAETVGLDALNNEKENEENKKEKSKLVGDGSDLTSERNDEKDKGSSRKEELSISPNGGFEGKSHPEDLTTTVAKESDDLTPKPEIRRDNPDLPKDAAKRSAKESDDLTSKEDIPSSSAKEPGDGALEEGPSNGSEALKVPDSVPSEKEEPEELIKSSSVTENGRKTGEEETKDFTNENQDPLETKDYHNVDKVKRAAVTAISAAAVKAKLLADQEEDQIRQLATLLIDKQLHKLETKLAFFSDMESVVMRVREQMERSKQRLYQERAHIIASRIGFSAPSSRPMQQSLPINRVAMGFANSAAKPPTGMGMTPQRPSISRSMMMSAPSAPNTFVPATSAGNPVRPTNQEKISSGPK